MTQPQRVAVVTGGGALGDRQGYGIGNAIARRLSQDGISIAVIELDQARADITVEHIRQSGGKGQAFIADVTDHVAVSVLIDVIAQRLGRIDILVNVVGKSGLRSEFASQDSGMWDGIIDINLRSVLNCTQASVPHILQQPQGRIVSISSEAAKTGEQGQAVYAACKAAIVAFSKSLAKELGPKGVTVNVVSPGTTNNAALRDRLARPEFKNIAQGWRDRIPVGRFGEPEEIASAVAFLISPSAGYITSQTMSVNGGSTMTG